MAKHVEYVLAGSLNLLPDSQGFTAAVNRCQKLLLLQPLPKRLLRYSQNLAGIATRCLNQSVGSFPIEVNVLAIDPSGAFALR